MIGLQVEDRFIAEERGAEGVDPVVLDEELHDQLVRQQSTFTVLPRQTSTCNIMIHSA